MPYSEAQIQESNVYLQNVMNALHNSGADQDESDPGYPGVIITNRLPENVAAQYESKENIRGKIFVSSNCLFNAMQTQMPFELVDSLVHERRHFKQDVAGVLDKNILAPPASSRRVILAEADAFAYTTNVMAKLKGCADTAWLTLRDPASQSSSAQAQAIHEQATSQALEGGATVAKSLMFGSEGGFAMQYLHEELDFKLKQLQNLQRLVSSHDVNKLTLSLGRWIVAMGEQQEIEQVPEYYKQTGFFADEHGNHEWIAQENFFEWVLEEHFAVFQEMLEAVREQYKAISHVSILEKFPDLGIEPRNTGGMA